MTSEPLKYAIVGVGAVIFDQHRIGVETVKGEIAAMTDISAASGRTRADALGCPFYTNHRAMLAEIKPDVVSIITPHPFHAPIAIDALEAGCHVLVEKPIAVHVAEADRMVDTAAKAGRLLAVNFQQRLRPEVRAAKKLLAEGRLGDIQYAHLTVTWTRTATYYRSSNWRGTWEGEGGGVLMNQAPHDLDLICHLVGMPARVAAWTRTRLHKIETEDTVHAMMEWPNGGLGFLHASTAEAGHAPVIEIIGTAGRLLVERGALTYERFESDIRDFIIQRQELFDSPGVQPAPVDLPADTGDHAAIYRNLEAAIREGAPLAADGAEGRMSLELANAMNYASRHGCEVALPLDRQAYLNLLNELKAKVRSKV